MRIRRAPAAAPPIEHPLPHMLHIIKTHKRLEMCGGARLARCRSGTRFYVLANALAISGLIIYRYQPGMTISRL
jgi:hypothetical protein